MATGVTWNDKVIEAIPIAEGSSYFIPDFCKQVGIDADALRHGLETTPGLWNDPTAVYMLNRGWPLKRTKFFVNLDHNLTRFYSYPGAQWRSTESYIMPTDARARLVVDAVSAMTGLAVDGKLVKMTHAIGTKYSKPEDSIGEHSDMPLDIANGSYIIGLSFPGANLFAVGAGLRTSGECRCRW